MSSLPGYDAWKTGGRYRQDELDVTCGECGNEFAATACSEYGGGWYDPEECPACGASISDDWEICAAEPPEPTWDDR